MFIHVKHIFKISKIKFTEIAVLFCTLLNCASSSQLLCNTAYDIEVKHLHLQGTDHKNIPVQQKRMTKNHVLGVMGQN